MPTVTNLREWVMFILTLFIVPALGTLAMLQFNEGKSTAALTQQTQYLAHEISKLESALEKMNDAFQQIKGAQVACDVRMLQLKAEFDALRADMNARKP